MYIDWYAHTHTHTHTCTCLLYTITWSLRYTISYTSTATWVKMRTHGWQTLWLCGITQGWWLAPALATRRLAICPSSPGKWARGRGKSVINAQKSMLQHGAGACRRMGGCTLVYVHATNLLVYFLHGWTFQNCLHWIFIMIVQETGCSRRVLTKLEKVESSSQNSIWDMVKCLDPGFG